MSVATILLLIAGLLVLFGLGQRVLDRMRLTDRQALVWLAAILIGSLIPDIPLGPVSVNIGGAVLPLALCIWLLVKADTAWERVRALLAALASAGAVLAVSYLMPAEPETMWLDVNWLYGPIAGILAYVLGRSRRAAFIAGVLGVLLADTTTGIINRIQGFAVEIRLGSGGILDAVLLSGFLAVALAEIIGEIRERFRGGNHPGKGYHKGEFVKQEGKS